MSNHCFRQFRDHLQSFPGGLHRNYTKRDPGSTFNRIRQLNSLNSHRLDTDLKRLRDLVAKPPKSIGLFVELTNSTEGCNGGIRRSLNRR